MIETLLNYLGLLTLISGFIMGLGAVTVIDIHGFLGRKSAYWTEATTRSHKITKPLIWLGILMVTIGGTIFYRDENINNLIIFHLISLVVLIINGLFLTLFISPYLIKREKEGMQRELLPQGIQLKITISFLISFTFWWSNLILFLWNLTAKLNS